MENVARASNLQFKPALLPQAPGRAAIAAKQPSPKENSDGKAAYTASGLGLRLCAPKVPAAFQVECTPSQERTKLKVCFSFCIQLYVCEAFAWVHPIAFAA